jgi:hypothetical protein
VNGHPLGSGPAAAHATVVMHAVRDRKEVETMATTALEQKRVFNRQAQTHGRPDHEGGLGVTARGSGRQRRTRNEFELPYNGGLTVILWALASLVAEVVLLSLFFAHVYGA